MPYFDPATGFETQTDTAPDWLRNAPFMGVSTAPAQPQSNWLSAGLSSGFHGLLSSVGSFGQGIGAITGLEGLESAGQGFAQSQQAAEQRASRPDLEQNPWSPAGIGYKVAQTVSGLVPAALGTAAANLIPGVGEAIDASWLARLGASAPRLLGGGAGLEGEAAATVGRQFARGVVGAGAGMLPQIAGGNIQAEQGGDLSQDVSRGEALKALAVGAPEAALAGLFPRTLTGGSGGVGLGSRILQGAMAGAGVGVVNSGLQTGLEQFLSDTDTPIGDRARAVVDSALQGGVIGGVLGGAFGVFHAPTKDPGNTSNNDLKGSVDPVLEQASPGFTTPSQPPPPPGATYAEMPSAQIKEMFDPLDAKGVNRSQAEGMQHVVLGDEIARRTAPGMVPGQGTLFEPEELAQRAPDIAAMAAKVIPSAANPKDPFVRTFNAANEPELVNSLQKRMADLNATGDKPSEWLSNLADQYGVGKDGKSVPLLDQSVALNDQLAKSIAAFRAARNAGDVDTIKATLSTINDLKVEIAKKDALVKIHNEAADLLAKAKQPPGPAGLLGSPISEGKFSEVPSEPTPPDLLTGPRNLLTPPKPGEGFNPTPETSPSQEAFRQSLQADLSSRFPNQPPGTAEAIGSINAENSAGLINDLRGKMLHAQEVGAPLHSVIEQLMVDHGMIDDGGNVRNLPEERDAAYADPAKAMRAQDAGSEISQIEKFQDLHAEANNGTVEGVPDNVRQSYAAQWKALDAVSDSSDPEVKKIAEDAKHLIETNAQNAGPQADLALSSIDRIKQSPEPVKEAAKRDFSKLSKSAPAPAVEPPVAPAPAAKPKVDPAIEDRIRQAHNEITGGGLNGRSQLMDLRDKLPDIPREDLNSALVALHEEPDNGIQLGRSDNPMDRSAERDAAGIAYKGELAHELLANPRIPKAPEAAPAPVVAADLSTQSMKQLRDKLKAIRADTEADDPRREDISDALRAGKKSGLIDLLRKFGASESGSLNIGGLFGRNPDTEPTRSPEAGEARVKAYKGQADVVHNQVVQTVRDMGSSAPVWLRKQALIAESLSGVVRIAGKYLRSSEVYRDTHEQKLAIESAKNKAGVLAAQAYHALKPEAKELVDEALVRLNDGSNLDIRKPLDPAMLADRNGNLLPNAAEISARHKEGMAVMSRLQQKGGRPALDMMLMSNQANGYQEVAATLHAFGKVFEATRGAEISGLKAHPDEQYQFRPDLHDSVQGTRDFYTGEAIRLHDALKNEYDARMAEAAAAVSPAKRDQILGTVEGLRNALHVAEERLGEINKGTYSPLGHGGGDYFVAGKVKTGADGKGTDPIAMSAVQDAFEKAGFHNIGFFHDSDSNQIMTRLDSMTKMERAANILRQAEADGHLVAGSTKNGHPDDPASMQRVTPKFIQEMIANIHDSVDRTAVDDETGQAIKGRMVSQLIDMLPDSSIVPNLQRRQFVSGFSKDMGETAILRSLNSARSSTNTSMAFKTAAAMSAMKQEVDAAKADPNLAPKEKLIGDDARRELMTREAQAAWRVPHSVIDSIRSAAHTISIGANIPYTVLPLSQIFTLSHGELAKKTSFVNAAKLLGSSAGEAFNIMRAVAASKDWSSLGFRESDLKAAGNISQKSIDTIMRLENAGGISSYTRAMSDLGEGAGSFESKIKNMGNAMGSYAETLPRVLTALAAGKLYDSKPAGSIKDRYGSVMSRDAYVKNVVDESQMRWGAGETSRLTGGKGPFGSLGKLAFAFTQFKTKMIEKLYGEVHDLLAKESTPELRKEAGKFLASHLAATVALAGSLGLPGVGLLAGVFDKVYAGLTGKDDMDIEGAYRTWLANVFGKGTADVLAKGLPRAAGVDLSHIGEENLIPFSEMVQDKRKFEDVEDDWLHHMAGPAVGELGEAYLGFRDIMNGDYMLGLQRALPGNLKDVAEAAYISQHGFVNRSGQQEPISPTESKIIMKALGFKSSAEAQYDEASKVAGGLKAQEQYRQQNISQHISRSILLHDPQEFQTWLMEAAKFQADHPGLRGPEQTYQRDFKTKLLQQNFANALGMPLGINRNDFIARSRLGFLDANQ